MNKTYEPNLMGNYFGSDTATYTLLEIIRLAALEGSPSRVDNGLIRQVKNEVSKVRRSIDRSTYEVAEELTNYVFGHVKPKRMVMLVTGDFAGDRYIEDSVLPIEFGGDYWTLFKEHSAQKTIDDIVTESQTRKFLRRYLDKIGTDYNQFNIKTSRFFYFVEEDLLRRGFLRTDGSIDLVALVPYISDTNGYVVTTSVSIPKREDYSERALPFTSHRFKTSLTRKILKKASEQEVNHSIRDWVAHRTVVSDEEQRDIVIGRFPMSGSEEPLTIGSSKIYTISVPYKKGGNKFEQRKVIARVKTRRFDVVREFQVWSLDDNYRFEIDQDDPAHHRHHKKQVSQLAREKKFLKDNYGAVLEEIFGRETIPVDLNELR